jgi:hypothetical protein
VALQTADGAQIFHVEQDPQRAWPQGHRTDQRWSSLRPSFFQRNPRRSAARRGHPRTAARSGRRRRRRMPRISRRLLTTNSRAMALPAQSRHQGLSLRLFPTSTQPPPAFWQETELFFTSSAERWRPDAAPDADYTFSTNARQALRYPQRRRRSFQTHPAMGDSERRSVGHSPTVSADADGRCASRRDLKNPLGMPPPPPPANAPPWSLRFVKQGRR